MKVVVIEDEPPAAEQLCDFMRRYDAEIAVAGVLASVKEAVRWFREHPAPDLILSDIQLLSYLFCDSRLAAIILSISAMSAMWRECNSACFA